MVIYVCAARGPTARRPTIGAVRRYACNRTKDAVDGHCDRNPYRGARLASSAEQEQLRRIGVEYCLSAYVDVHGIPKCKAVPIDHFVAMMQGSELFTGAALDGLGQEPSDDELSVRPDLDAITVLPWEPTVAWAPGQLTSTTSRGRWIRAPFCGASSSARRRPRAHVQPRDRDRVLPRPDGRTGRSCPPIPRTSLPKAAYDIVGLLENMSYMDELVKYMNILGWDVHSFDHEDANSQFEFDFSYTDALGMADRLDAVAA